MSDFPRDPTANTQAAHQNRVAALRRRASRKAEEMLACEHANQTTHDDEVDGIKTRYETCEDCGMLLNVRRA